VVDLQPLGRPEILRSWGRSLVGGDALVGGWLTSGLRMLVIGLGADGIGFVIGHVPHRGA
jgi:hypothetical protein